MWKMMKITTEDNTAADQVGVLSRLRKKKVGGNSFRVGKEHRQNLGREHVTFADTPTHETKHKLNPSKSRLRCDSTKSEEA